jgi:uncharacterized protein
MARLLDFLARRLIYVPSRADSSLDKGPDYGGHLPPFEEQWIETPDGHRLHAWYAAHPQARTAMLFCHGNAGHLAMRGPDAAVFRQRFQCSVLLFDYRGYGRSRGLPTEAGVCLDAQSAFERLQQLSGFGVGQSVVFGRSLGAAIAVELARRTDGLGALILASPFTSISDMCGQLIGSSFPARFLSERFASIDKVASLTLPIMVVHGECDSLIPVAQGLRLFAAIKGEDKVWREVSRADHNDLLVIGGEPLLCLMEDFISAHS